MARRTPGFGVTSAFRNTITRAHTGARWHSASGRSQSGRPRTKVRSVVQTAHNYSHFVTVDQEHHLLASETGQRIADAPPRPVCTGGGRRTGRPEDCGGAGGYRSSSKAPSHHVLARSDPSSRCGRDDPGRASHGLFRSPYPRWPRSASKSTITNRSPICGPGGRFAGCRRFWVSPSEVFRD